MDRPQLYSCTTTPYRILRGARLKPLKDFTSSISPTHLTLPISHLCFFQRTGGFIIICIWNCRNNRQILYLIPHTYCTLRLSVVLIFIVHFSLTGLLVVVYGFVSNFYLMFVCSVVVGFLYSVEAIEPNLVINIIGLENVSSGVSSSFLLCAVGTMLGGPLSGWAFEMDPTYHSSFILSGLCLFTHGAVNFPFWLRFRHTKTEIVF